MTNNSSERRQTVPWTPEQVESFWNFENSAPANFSSVQSGHRLAKRMAPHLRGKRILEFGCGTGHLLLHMLPYAAEVAGCDISPGCRAATNKLLSGEAKFRGAYSPAELIDRGDRFDVIVCSEVIEHLDDQQLRLAMSHIVHLLSSRGTLIVTTPNSETLSDGFVRCPECASVFHRWQHVRSWTQPALTHFLEGNGFKSVRVDQIDPGYRPDAVGKLALWLLEKYKRQRYRPTLYAVAGVA